MKCWIEWIVAFFIPFILASIFHYWGFCGNLYSVCTLIAYTDCYLLPKWFSFWRRSYVTGITKSLEGEILGWKNCCIILFFESIFHYWSFCDNLYSVCTLIAYIDCYLLGKYLQRNYATGIIKSLEKEMLSAVEIVE